MHQSENLEKKIAVLETHVDHLETELHHLNRILIQCGFPEGVKTLKLAVQDLLYGDQSPLSFES
jgi:chaperonin cofactor prefoldin